MPSRQAKSSLLCLAALFTLGFVLLGCRPTTHPMAPASLGVPRSSSELERVLGEPGPVEVETVVGAEWEIARGGLINLDHPKARHAGLTDDPEAIQIFFHALKHPERGLYIVDTGVERALRDAPDDAAIRGLVASFMSIDTMKVRTDTAGWLKRQPQRLSGVFLTHLHLDHVSGMPDVPKGTPIYAGRGEGTETTIENLFVRGVMDRELEGHAPILEWRFQPDADRRFDGVLDVFGDRSVWALHVPGHTPGSTAYLVRTPKGPVLLVGDACHTAWGWTNGVEPGTFSDDGPRSATSLARLRALVARHPAIDVRLGHQALGAAPGARAARVQSAKR